MTSTRSWATPRRRPFTPDRTHIVFGCFDFTGGQGIFLMKADGSDAGTPLTHPASTCDTGAEVSPDGQTVTFVRRKVEGEQALFRRRHHGHIFTSSCPIGSTACSIKHDWAPDGQHIVFSSPIEGQANAYTIKPDGCDRIRLTNVQPGRGASVRPADGDRLPAGEPLGPRVPV